MGLLKNLITNSISNGISNGINKGIKNAVSGAVEKAIKPVAQNIANQTANTLSKSANDITKSANDLSKATQELSSAAAQAKYAADGLDAAVKIRKVLAESFSSYEVKENVSPSTIGGNGKFMNYTFGVFSGGTPQLFIMLVGKTTCSSRLYRWSKEQAERSGIKMINFVQHYPNNVDYIKDRLQKYL